MEGEIVGLAGAGVVVGLVAVLRQAVAIPDRFTPLLAIAMGIAWNVGLKAGEVSEEPWGAVAILGVLSGLAASGLWSGGKATVEYARVDRPIIPPGDLRSPDDDPARRGSWPPPPS